MHYLMIYELSDDYIQRRGQFRSEHLKLAWQAQERGDLLIAGALADPADKAILVFKGDSAAVAEKFAAADPYVKNGLVRHWHIRQWTTVIGKDADTPVRPE